MIEFMGIRSDEKYIVVEHYPKRIIPKRKYISMTVPGRSRDIFMEESEDAFENYNQSYSVFIDSKAPGLSQVARGLSEWLLASPGYHRLEDSYDPDFYRAAVYVGGEEFINYFNEYGRGTLTFNCDPKRFYKSGEKSIAVTNGAKIYSPSVFKAHPIYVVDTKGTSGSNRVPLTLNITDKNGNVRSFTIGNAGVYGTVTIDSEAHTAIRYGQGSDRTNFNSYVQDNYENLYLGPDSSISWDATKINSVTITPRWWTI